MADHRCRVALALLAAASWTGGCARREAGAVAPFGGDVAAVLPYRDVLGFVRFRPGDELATRLADLVEKAPVATRLGVLGPATKMVQLLDRGEAGFIGRDDPFVVLFLDASVHGASAAFAWRGDARRFREVAGRGGVRIVADDRIELPGRGRVDGIGELALEAAQMRQFAESEDPAGSARGAALPSVTYHVIERDGITLLAPARDGARNLFASLAATRVLAPGEDEAAILRFDLGRVVGEIRDFVRNAAWPRIDEALMSLNPGRRAGRHDDFDGWRDYMQLRSRAIAAFDGLFDALDSTEHLFARWDHGRLDLYLLAEQEGFMSRLLPLLRNRPTKELVAGAPIDADAVVAFSIDPKILPDVPSIWRAMQRGLFQRRRSRDRFDFGPDATADDAKPFLASFGGRCWLALSSRESADEMPVSLRIFAEMSDDESSQGMVEALLEETVPANWMKVIRLTSLTAYRKQRVPGGCVEVVGAESGAAIALESRRLAEPEPFEVPWDGPEEAFWFGRFLPPSQLQPITVALTRDASGVRAAITLPQP